MYSAHFLYYLTPDYQRPDHLGQVAGVGGGRCAGVSPEMGLLLIGMDLRAQGFGSGCLST